MSNKIENDSPKKNNFTSKLGSFMATVLVGCISACVIAVCIALTYRFIIWVL